MIAADSQRPLAAPLLPAGGSVAVGGRCRRSVLLGLGMLAVASVSGLLAALPAVRPRTLRKQAVDRPSGKFDSILPSVELAAPSAPGAVKHVPEAPPVFRLAAASYYEAGLKHGQVAKERIVGWLDSAQMRSTMSFVSVGSGREVFDRMKRDNTAEFPDYLEELRGIADGAGVSLDGIWASNLLVELGNLMSSERNKSQHCSDIFAISPGGYVNGFAHGHNEDWSDTVKGYWYFLAYSYDDSMFASPRLDFAGCGGVTYPGTLVGWVPTWNRHGMYLSANVLVPRHQRRGGLASAFVQHRAFCRAHNMDEALAGLSIPGWTGSVSINLVDLNQKRMANLEVWEDLHSVLEVTEVMGNYSHFNQFKHLQTRHGKPIDDPATFVHDPRQKRVDEMPAAHSATDVMARLSDPLVFRPHATIVTLVLNGTTGRLNVWCATPSETTDPVYSWDLNSFFD